MLPAKAYLIPDKEAEGFPLHRLPAEAGAFSEDWLQDLLFRHASLLPLEDIGAEFSPGIPVGREIANTDVLLVSPGGAITIVETKLWRNPEAHRTVVAQILEYAKTLSGWSYADLNEAVLADREKRSGRRETLHGAVKRVSGSHVSEIEFQEAVEESLHSGRFALLIVGDRIYPGATQLAEVIQAAPHLHFTIAFVELACFRLNGDADWPLVVVPRVVAKTREYTRAVVRVIYEEKKPEILITTPEEDQRPGRASLSTFTASVPSGLADHFHEYLEKWKSEGYTVFWGQVGFSIRLLVHGKLTTIFDAYPRDASIYQASRAQKIGVSEQVHSAYRDEISRSRVLGTLLATGKRYVHYDRLSEDEVVLLLSATDRLLGAIAASNL